MKTFCFLVFFNLVFLISGCSQPQRSVSSQRQMNAGVSKCNIVVTSNPRIASYNSLSTKIVCEEFTAETPEVEILQDISSDK